MSYSPEVMVRCPDAATRGVPTRPILWLALLAAALVTSACRVIIVSGPSTVGVGETVTYVLLLSASDTDVTEPELLAEVPEGWLLQSVTYQATIDGEPVSGSGVDAASTLCDTTFGDVRPGFRRWHFRSVEPLVANPGDTGTLTLEFLVDGQPAGEFDLYFLLASFGPGVNAGCGGPEIFTVNADQPRFLTLLQTLRDGEGGIDALGGARQAAPSPDGRHLYVAGEVDRAVAVFSRDPTTGELAFVEAEVNGVGGVDGLDQPTGVAVSPDSNHVYVVGPGAVAAFSRDPATGELTFIERLLDGADNLALSPDGRHLYAASQGGMSVYARDEVSGELTFLESVSPGGRIAFSADGRHLYAAGGVLSKVYVFGRDEVSGELTLLDEVEEGIGGVSGIEGVDEVAVTSDGGYLYSVADESQAVAVFERDPVSGLLTFVEAVLDLTGEGFVLEPRSLAISPDGSHLVVSGQLATVVYERQGTGGGLTRVEVLYSGNLPVGGLEESGALVFAPGGRHLYAVATSSDAVLALGTAILFTDGFESGSTSAWSSVFP